MEMPRDEEPRSEKPNTIHDCAQSGDVDGIKKLLEDNSALINQKNAFMLETPLHIAAICNKTEIIKFLVEREGDDKVDLKAKNAYGETPLHVAAKNGCNEAARLLLSHGALIEAKAKNGMTPLHLAAWHSLRTDDFSIVKTLLEHNADCSATDKDKKSPVDHLSERPEGGKLHGLLLSHQAEQRKKKAVESCGEIKAKMDELEKQLSKIVGLNDLKTQLRKWARGMLLDERRRILGLNVGKKRPPHMAFLGSPGTGKTMVARILGKLLHSVGVLSSDKVIEVQRTDLVGQYIGHTGPMTRRKIKEAEGGILFVDEAYRLMPSKKRLDDHRDFGLEALEEIMSVMDSGKVLVIFAGYKEPMQHVISSNEGFCRRVTNFFTFNDLSCEELANIVHLKMKDQAKDSLLRGYKLHDSCTTDAIAALIEKGTTKELRMKMNGGLVGPMLDNAKGNLDLRLSDDCLESEELSTITLEDLEAGLRSLSGLSTDNAYCNSLIRLQCE